VDYILRRTGVDKYVCELGAPQPFQPFQLFHGALEQAHLSIFGQFCAPALQVRPDCAPKILLKTALLCSLGPRSWQLAPSARVCISDTDRLLMFYLVLIMFSTAIIFIVYRIALTTYSIWHRLYFWVLCPNGNAPYFIILMSHTSRFCLSRGECWRSQIR
jgi:hypothetical protein